MKVTLLGTGTSHGVPMIGCDCAVCSSSDPRDRRTRPSIHIEQDGVHVLVDTAPELRLQCIANRVSRVDAVLFTHHHADHVTGLDDLRRFNWLQGHTLTCYAQDVDITVIKRMFIYAFQDDPDYPSAKPDLVFVPIIGPLQVRAHTEGLRPPHSVAVTPVPLMHGPIPVLGFRLGNFAYCTDCNHIPDASLELLQGLDVLVLDALRKKPHPTHFNLEQAIAWARRIEAKQTFFTHITHELPHRQTNEELPARMALGYDGQVIEL